jgi:glycosyltransferase involved in cell wall biosynthesis
VTADVSVVIPTRGRLDLLSCAVGTALGQQGVEVDVIVVDDASPDTTAAWVANRKDPRLRLVRHATQRGVSAARNSGVREARGTWVAFLDDDDMWAPDKLMSQLSAATAAGRGWVYTGEVHVDERLSLLGGGPPLPPAEAMAMLSSYNTLPAGGSNVVVRADLLVAVGPFDVSLRRTEDWDMWIRLARTGPPAWVCRPLLAYRHHRGNAGTDPAPMVSEPRLLARRYGISVDVPAMMRRAAWTCLQDGRRMRAVRYYLRAAARGDVRSLARVAVALTHPAIAAGQVYRLIDWPPEAREWAAGAESWLAPLRAAALRAAVSADNASSEPARGTQPAPRGS